MTTPDIPHRFEIEIEVLATPEQVWEAIASAAGISSWMMPTEMEPRVGGAITFHMGPDDASTGRVTAFEPGRRVAYEEDWASLVGQAGADVTPLLTEFLIESRSGGSSVVRVVTSAFGTGAEWEHEFWDEMQHGWAPMLDNLRLYLTRFPGQTATILFAAGTFATAPESAVTSLRDALGIVGDPGERVTARGVTGTVERSIPRHFMIAADHPVTGLLSFYSFGTDGSSGVHLIGYLFSDDAPAYVASEQDAWREWLASVADGAAAERIR